MNLEIKKFDELTPIEVYEILRVRSEVFVVEQNCVYNDEDGKDIESIHIMIKKNDKIIAYLRVIKPGISYDNASIGRVLVTPESRKMGLARKIVCAGMDYIINNWNEEKITIGAEDYLKKFYKSLGFKVVSEVYLEDGIPHVKMTYNKR
ncbi:MAG: GNAT family N-acetyltransferase [Psychrilyobacter sp.]|uniref:GNAT family N-acetyltransferase n=1 Tax=Psychrilyobacter sp. TaxID=2586924 RepID=UPI003C74037D